MESCEALLHAEWEPQKLTHVWEKTNTPRKLFQEPFSSSLAGSPSKQARGFTISLRNFEIVIKQKNPIRKGVFSYKLRVPSGRACHLFLS